jgi:phosphate transport system protein
MQRKTFSQEMQEVKDRLLLLSSMVEQAVMDAAQQPIAHGLRLLASSLDICTEFERMRDYAKGIAILNLRSEGLSFPHVLKDVYSMAEKAVDMLHRAMTTFANEDPASAEDILQEDDIIDESYSRLYQSVEV